MPWKLTVVLNYWNAKETYSRSGLLKCHGNLQSYWTTVIPRKLTVVLDYWITCEFEVGLWTSSDWSSKTWSSTCLIVWLTWNLQSYWTTAMPRKLTVVLGYWNVMETYIRIVLLNYLWIWGWTLNKLWLIFQDLILDLFDSLIDLKLTVVLDYWSAMETYSRIGLLECHGNLQSYWITSDLRVWGWGSNWSSAMAIGLSAWNIQSYWTTEMSWKLTVVLDYWNSMETYSRIGLLKCHGNLKSYWTTEMPWKSKVVLE